MTTISVPSINSNAPSVESLQIRRNDTELSHVPLIEVASEELEGYPAVQWPVVTYHIYGHPLNPGRERPKRNHPVPGHSIIFQTTPSSAIPKDIKAAAKALPKVIKKIVRAKTPTMTVDEAIEEWDRLRGDVWGVYKPKRKGNPLLFWKKRPPAEPEFRIAKGVRSSEKVVGKLRNDSTWKQNAYSLGFYPEHTVDGSEEKEILTDVDPHKDGVVLTHQSIWKPRSPFTFEVDGRKMSWKGTKIKDGSKKKFKWMARYCHLKLSVEGPFADEDLLRRSGKFDAFEALAGKTSKQKMAQDKGDLVPEVVIAKFTRVLAGAKIGRLRIDREAIQGVFGEEKRAEFEKWIFPTIAAVMKTEQSRREKARIILEIIAEIAEDAGGA